MVEKFKADKSHQKVAEGEFYRPISRVLDVGVERIKLLLDPYKHDQCILFNWREWDDAKLRHAGKEVARMIQEVQRIIPFKRRRELLSCQKEIHMRLWQFARDLGYRPARRMGYSLDGRTINYYIGEVEERVGESFELFRCTNQQLSLVLPLIKQLRLFFQPSLALQQKGGVKSRHGWEVDYAFRFFVILESVMQLRRLYDEILSWAQWDLHMRANSMSNRIEPRAYISSRLRKWKKDTQGFFNERPEMKTISELTVNAGRALHKIAGRAVCELEKVGYASGPGFPRTRRSRERFVCQHIGTLLKAVGITRITQATYLSEIRKWQHQGRLKSPLRKTRRGDDVYVIPRCQ